ncbi:hypothetical protein ACWEOE_10730 [Amycolatopsis sp. NPDC004368]
MTINRHPPLLPNPEVRERTAKLMNEHAERMEAEHGGMFLAAVEAAALRTQIGRVRALLANPTIADADKVLGASAILDGAAPFLPFVRGAS